MARGRVAYLDNLKLLAVAVIIAGHGALAYGGLKGAWPYQDVREVKLGAVSDVALSIVVVPVAAFVMDLFFLISGGARPQLVRRCARRCRRWAWRSGSPRSSPDSASPPPAKPTYSPRSTRSAPTC
jgi:hypothetical protein